MQKEHTRVNGDFLEEDNLVIMSLKVKFVFNQDTDPDGSETGSRHVGQVNSVFLDDCFNNISRQPSQNV